MTIKKEGIAVLYHHPCHDGLGAMWVFKQAHKNSHQPIEYIPINYGQEIDFSQFLDRTVYLLDFSFKRPEMLELADWATNVIVIDHHDSAEKELVNLPNNVVCHFDMKHSGAMLTWLHFFPRDYAPRFISHIEDRDMWWFKDYNTKAFHEGLLSFSTPAIILDAMYLETNYKLTLQQTYQGVLKAGTAILKYKANAMKDILEDKYLLTIAGHKVLAVNCPYIWSSDICHILLSEYPEYPFAATYSFNGNGFKFSLRSTDKPGCVFVNEIAADFGGGGHPFAAGFTVASFDDLNPPTACTAPEARGVTIRGTQGNLVISDDLENDLLPDSIDILDKNWLDDMEKEGEADG